MIALRLPPEIEDRLEALAKRTGLSADDHARDAILEYLENLEDLELAERRVDALGRGESDTTPLAELLAQHA